MDRQQQWQPVLLEETGEITSHREPGEEFLFYRSVAAGLIDAVQDNCSRGAGAPLKTWRGRVGSPITRSPIFATTLWSPPLCSPASAWREACPWRRPSA